MDEAKNGTIPLISNGGQDVAISMDGVLGDKQRYQQQLQLIDEQVRLSAFLPVLRQVLYGGTGDGAGNTAEENSSVFSLIRMR